jgi:hypothetical protein
LAYGCLSPPHAGQFKAFVKQVRSKYRLTAILKGDAGWPSRPEDRDVLYFLSQSFRAYLLKELPAEAAARSDGQRQLAHRAKGLMKDLAIISLEMAQMVVAEQDGEVLPGWFMAEIVRDLPRLVEKKHAS